jgi:5-methylcytosine-specific restriction endonuclease McrA
MSVAEIIYKNLESIIEFCKQNPKEMDKLLSIKESKDLFHLNYAFFIETKDIDDGNTKKSSLRYKSNIYSISNKKVRVTNDWYKRNIPYVKNYFIKNNITPISPIESNETIKGKVDGVSIKRVNSRENSRYKGNAIGNAQNLLIRNILSNLGNESFNESDWQQTKQYFDNKCAYCGKEGDLVMEHAIPINKEKLGEHKIGNIVPACKECNKAKADKDYREFLGNNLDTIEKIDKYMEMKKYVPLEDNEKLKNILNMAYEEVSQIADRYINIVNDVFITNNEKV